MPDLYTSPQRSWKRILPLAALYAAVNLFAFRLEAMWSEGSQWEDWRIIIGRNLVMGFIFSQIAALSMALVFAPGRFISRLAFWWSLGAVLWLCGAMGWGIVFGSLRNGMDWVWNIVFSIPVASLVVQAPLWALRLCFGWRWAREEDAPANSGVRWSLGDLLTGTTLVALSLGLFRFSSYPHGFWMSSKFFGAFAVTLGLIGLSIAMVLTLRRWNWCAGAAVFMAYVIFGACMSLLIHPGLDGLRRESEFSIWLTVPPYVAFGVGLLLATLTVRSFGYRLVMGQPNLAD